MITNETSLKYTYYLEGYAFSKVGSTATGNNNNNWYYCVVSLTNFKS
jgi:hypothetical protein